MSKLPKAFKRKSHGKMQDFSSVPAGDYLVKITDSDYVETKSKDGHRLKLTFEIQNKEFKGKKLFAGLNLDNPNEQAVELANNELATILDAAGKASIKDSKELHGILMAVSVRVVPAEGKYPEKNEINMYSSISDGDDELDEGEEDELDKGEEDELDKGEDDDDEITADFVKEQAKKYKGNTSLKALKKMLSEYDIEKISQIAKLSEDDLESLSEDLADEL